MANYLYNGIELPQLPEWDKETYPYAIINDSGLMGYNLLRCSQTPFSTALDEKERVIITNGGLDCIGYGCYDERSTIREPSEEWKLDSYTTVGSYIPYLRWSNHDILNDDGTIYFAGSEPVDPNAPTPAPLDPKSLLMGWIVGRRIAGQRGKRTPTAYIYNGVQLPALPEWDRVAYPYAYVYQTSSGRYCTAFVSAPLHQLTGTAVSDGLYSDGVVSYLVYEGLTADGEWGERIVNSTRTIGMTVTLVWCNQDTMDQNGNLYLTASEPTPTANGQCVYGGIRLPPLPEWGKEKYPYAYIGGTTALNMKDKWYYLYLTPEPLVKGSYLSSWNVQYASYVCKTELSELVWSFVSEKETDVIHAVTAPALWASYDIYTDDGTLYLAASEPIPVYT